MEKAEHDSSARSAATLPVIDISGLSSSDPEKRRAVGAEIRGACLTSGFLYCVGHGIPDGLRDAVFAETRRFFDQPLDVKVRVDKGLLECDFGEWTGAELKRLMKLPEWGTVQRAPSTFTFPGGESFTAMQTRMVSTIDRLRAQHPGGTIVLVSHADPIKAAVAHAMGTHIDLFQRIVISTCGVSAIAYGAGAPIVLTVNSTGGSLAELQPS